MSINHDHSVAAGGQLPGVADLPLIIEQLLDQLDDLRAVLASQQAQLDRQAARIDALERR
jgi:hypothetical protein